MGLQEVSAQVELSRPAPQTIRGGQSLELRKATKPDFEQQPRTVTFLGKSHLSINGYNRNSARRRSTWGVGAAGDATPNGLNTF
jgi:hypothetical protein